MCCVWTAESLSSINRYLQSLSGKATGAVGVPRVLHYVSTKWAENESNEFYEHLLR